MECPRCDSPLERYALGGREAVSCDRCGYIGVPVEHRGELRDVESWDDAVSRFHEVSRVRAGTVEVTGDATPTFAEEGGDAQPAPTVVRIETPDTDLPGGSERNDEVDDGSDAGVAKTDDGVTCDVCGERFDKRAQLNGHMAVHSGHEE